MHAARADMRRVNERGPEGPEEHGATGGGWKCFGNCFLTVILRYIERSGSLFYILKVNNARIYDRWVNRRWEINREEQRDDTKSKVECTRILKVLKSFTIQFFYILFFIFLIFIYIILYFIYYIFIILKFQILNAICLITF